MTLDRYMLRLWLGPFSGGLALVLAMLLLGRALKLLGTVTDTGQALALTSELLMLTLPYFLLLTVPMAFFLSIQNSIATLQQGSEMDALRASGVSYRRLLRSFFLLAILLWLALTWVAMIQMPQAQLGFNNILTRAYAMKGVISFTPKRFNHGFGDLTVYVEGEDDQGVYHGVVIEDRRDGVSVIYTAQSAQFDMNADDFELRLTHGVRLEGKGASQRMLAFKKYQLAIATSDGQWQRRRSNEHVTMMTPEELWRQMGDGHPDAVAEWNRRLLLPSTVLVLFFFALPFSLSRKRSGKAGSLIAGIALLLLLYNVQLLLHQQVSRGAYGGWAMWFGQGAMLALGVYLWRCAERDRMPGIISRVGDWFYFMHQAVINRLARRS